MQGINWVKDVALAVLDLARSAEVAESLGKAVRDLLATWQRNRARPGYGTGAPGPLYVAGMVAEADAMIAALSAALEGEKVSGRKP
jgi:hypothetical protein